MSAVLGFDFGLARIGVAVGNLESGHAGALTVLHARDGRPDWNKVAALVATWQPAAFVVGRPYGGGAPPPSGPASVRLSQELLKFRAALHTRFGLPVEFADETYTSVEARHLLSEQRRAGRPRKVRKGEIDMTAAALILQAWLARARTEKSN